MAGRRGWFITETLKFGDCHDTINLTSRPPPNEIAASQQPPHLEFWTVWEIGCFPATSGRTSAL